MFELRNRGRLDANTQSEFEHIYSRLTGLLSQVFDVDGNLIVADPNLAIMPVGGIVPFAGTTAAAGYLLCNGDAYSRVDYKPLFDVIGTTYGAGDGSTTFNIPDLRQRFPLGKAASGTGSTLGGTGGAIDHTHSGGSHTHSITSVADHNHAGATSSAGDHSHSGSTGAEASHTHTFTTGTPSAVEAVTDTSGETDVATYNHTHTGTTDAGSSHAHSISASGTHSHTINSDGGHDHGGATGSASGTTGTGNPPYISVNYLIYAGV